MYESNVQRTLDMLNSTARALARGGWARSINRADYVPDSELYAPWELRGNQQVQRLAVVGRKIKREVSSTKGA